jgi:phosphoribosylformylglycinamidine synthase
VIKPLTGPLQIGPSDAAVIRPKLNSPKGLVIACGLAPHIDDPYQMAIAAIDEAIRNAVCVGATLNKLALLDNFCWPSVDDEETMGALVAACEACYDAAKSYGVPFISGKDSLHNQFTNQETGEVLKIPNTLLISAIGIIDDVSKCVTMDLKKRPGRVVLVRTRRATDLAALAGTHRWVAHQIRSGVIRSAHDVSEGGYAVAAAEMCIASGLGLIVGNEIFERDEAFEHRNGSYLLEIDSDASLAPTDAVEVSDFGIVHGFKKLTITTQKERVTDISIEELTNAWRGMLDW